LQVVHAFSFLFAKNRRGFIPYGDRIMIKVKNTNLLDYGFPP
jgi:hypothetical protein